MKKYRYILALLSDAKKNDTVFVPNATALQTIEIYRYFTGYRKDFPAYQDGGILVVNVTEEAWCKPSVYLEAYCPPVLPCIIRK